MFFFDLSEIEKQRDNEINFKLDLISFEISPFIYLMKIVQNRNNIVINYSAEAVNCLNRGYIN